MNLPGFSRVEKKAGGTLCVWFGGWSAFDSIKVQKKDGMCDPKGLNRHALFRVNTRGRLAGKHRQHFVDITPVGIKGERFSWVKGGISLGMKVPSNYNILDLSLL